MEVRQILIIGLFFRCVNSQVQSTGVAFETVDAAPSRPIRRWDNFQLDELPPALPPATFETMTLAQCLRQCQNIATCRSVDFRPAFPPDNCQLHPSCSTNPVELVASVDFSHYLFMDRCGETFNLVRFDGQGINALPAGTPFSVTFVNPPVALPEDCALRCIDTPNCQAAEFITPTTQCGLFVPTSPTGAIERLCFPTTANQDRTTFQYPCLDTNNAAAFGVVSPGIYPLLTAGQELQNRPLVDQQLNYDQCLQTCRLDPLCGGIRFSSSELFFIPTPQTPLPARCVHYASTNSMATPNILDRVCLRLITPSVNVFTILKEDCIRTDTGLIGAMVQSQHTTLLDCLTGCRNEPACVAADWDKTDTKPPNQRCWFHSEANGGCFTPYPRICCDHYPKIPTPCRTFDNYLMITDANIISGVGMLATTSMGVAITTLAACRTACNDAAPNCQGFDFTETGQCLLYNANNVCSAMRTCTGCVHNRIKTFSCFWEFAEYHKSGGSLVPGIVTVAGCERACRLDGTCQGFDFKTTSPLECFVHRPGSICSRLLSNNQIRHYRVRTLVCNELNGQNDTLIANASWGNTMQNFHSVGNDLLEVMVKSAHHCLQLCLQRSSTCYGVDYDKRTRSCYSATRSNACSTGVYDTCCDRLQLPNACLPPQVSGFTTFVNRHRLRGTRIDGVSSLADCADRCRFDPRCAAFDWNTPRAQCWFQTTTQECRNVNPVVIPPDSCCDRYVKIAYTCPTPFVPPSFNGYTTQVFRQVLGAVIERTDLNTEELCRQGCDNLGSQCVTFDYNFLSTVCYLHNRQTDPCPENDRNNTDVHRYVRTNNCV